MSSSEEEEEEADLEDDEAIEHFPSASTYSGSSLRRIMHGGGGERGDGDVRSSASSFVTSSVTSRGFGGRHSRSPVRGRVQETQKLNIKAVTKESESESMEEDIAIPEGVSVPSHYLCPISLEMMADPVVCADGHTYGRASIMRWLQENDRSPMTGEQLPHSFLTPNFTLRSMIVEFREKNGF
jgi:hypothetical protein